jgi:hypothetical protein
MVRKLVVLSGLFAAAAAMAFAVSTAGPHGPASDHGSSHTAVAEDKGPFVDAPGGGLVTLAEDKGPFVVGPAGSSVTLDEDKGPFVVGQGGGSATLA